MARVAIVTGGTRGIGRAICEALKADGMTVVANYAGNEEKARAFSDATGIPAYKWDVGDHEATLAGCKQVEAEVGPIDVLVNNAGITRDGTLLKMSFEDWYDVMRINLGGCFNMAKGLLPGHEGTRLGPDRQHRLDQRPGRPVRPGQLCRGQERDPRLHQGAGAGRRAVRRDRQRDRSGLHRHRYGRGGARGGAGEDRRQDPGRAGSARPKRSRAGCPSLHPRTAGSSPARRCRSTAASTCIEVADFYHPPVKRSVEIAGHKTSISLEPLFWDLLRQAAAREGVPLNALVARIDAERITAPAAPGLAGAIRLWLVANRDQ
jgi:predicted DNA-binding ribbon-helix-helix protein